MDTMSIKPPCGADCFSHISTIQSPSADAGKDVDIKTESNIKTESVDTKSTTGKWSGQDVTLYHLLQPIYGNNHCIIADMLQTKTCKQVQICIDQLQCV